MPRTLHRSSSLSLFPPFPRHRRILEHTAQARVAGEGGREEAHGSAVGGGEGPPSKGG